MNRIAIQGVPGSYSEEAARMICGARVELVECADFAAVFAALREKTADGIAFLWFVLLEQEIFNAEAPRRERRQVCFSSITLFVMTDN